MVTYSNGETSHNKKWDDGGNAGETHVVYLE